MFGLSDQSYGMVVKFKSIENDSIPEMFNYNGHIDTEYEVFKKWIQYQ